jgi:hypothetical protein
MKITAYQVIKDTLEIKPSKTTRKWMDESINRHPYRCLPMLVANSYGWDLISKSEFTAEWNGGQYPKDVIITKESGTCFPTSHFGEGTITWHTGFLFRTEYPYGVFVTGSQNEPVKNITCLSGIVETHWLSFPFTLNWKFTTPSKIKVNIGDVISQLMPIKLDMFDHVEAEIKSIDNDPELKKEYEELCKHRSEFNSKPDRKKEEWQKNYFQGTKLSGESEEFHFTKIKVPSFTGEQT